MKKENKKSSIKLLVLMLISVFTLVNCDVTDPTVDDTTTGAITCNSTDTVLSGTYDSTQPITISGTCAMSGIVSISSGNTITIDAGSTIIMDAGATPATVLIIEPGATINANGTAAQPVVFTSSATSPAYGDWGGVTIRGNATINTGSGASYTSEAEDGGTAGGSDDADNSGSLTYVRIEYGGKQMSSTAEYNGLSLEAVGSGTTIDNIHVHNNADDGIEFFGGTVNVSHVISTNNHDDMLDWTYGYRGKIQFALLGLYGGASDASMSDSNFIEADGSDNDELATPISSPTIYNLTGLSDAYAGYKQMIKFRRGTGIKLYNAYIANVCEVPDVESDETLLGLTGSGGGTNLADGDVIVDNSLFEAIDTCGTAYASTVELEAATSFKDSAGTAAVPAGTFFGGSVTTNATMTTAGIDATDPTAASSTFSPVPTASITTNAATPSGTFFDASAVYIGAFSASDTWADWTAY